MKKLIVANWKLNPATFKEAKQLFGKLKRAKSKNAEVVICPPFVYLGLLRGAKLGAQTVSLEEKGAFTGEISVLQLKDLKVEYVIVGHSERRKNFGETDEIVAKKMQLVLGAGITPILCIDNENQLSIISNFKFQMSNLVVAYEPLFAIGTGKNCEPADVKKMAETIKQRAGDVKILYGGSVNSENAKSYLEIVDGLLVGGASLNAEEFIKIVKNEK